MRLYTVPGFLYAATIVEGVWIDWFADLPKSERSHVDVCTTSKTSLSTLILLPQPYNTASASQGSSILAFQPVSGIF